MPVYAQPLDVGILVLRVLYMFSHSFLVRTIVVAVHVISIVSTVTILALLLNGRSLLTPLFSLEQYVHLKGCTVHAMTGFWHLFLPALVLHTVLYLVTVMRLLSCEDSPKALLIRRLHRE